MQQNTRELVGAELDVVAGGFDYDFPCGTVPRPWPRPWLLIQPEPSPWLVLPGLSGPVGP